MTNGNEAAFPEVQAQPQFNTHTYGLTKREYFAALLYAANVSNPQPYDDSATYAVECADSLIRALNAEVIRRTAKLDGRQTLLPQDSVEREIRTYSANPEADLAALERGDEVSTPLAVYTKIQEAAKASV